MSIQEYIGTERDSFLADDIEALSRALPTIVLAKKDATGDDVPRLEEAIEAVSYTIANLRDVYRREVQAAR